MEGGADWTTMFGSFWSVFLAARPSERKAKNQRECAARGYSTSLICYHFCSGLGLHSPECVRWRARPETSPPPLTDLDRETHKARRVVASDK